MPNLTPNSGLYTWLENDYVDFTEMNDNFTKIDKKICREEGTTSARVCIRGVSGSTATITWRYRKYPATSGDTTVTIVELAARYTPSNVRCNTQLSPSSLYKSGTVCVELPIALSSVYDMNIHCVAGNTNCWAANISNNTIPMDLREGGVNPFDNTVATANGFKFNIISTEGETEVVDRYKQIFFSVKGVLA